MNKQEIEKAIYVMKNIKHLLVDVIGNKNNEKELDMAISALEQQLTGGWIPATGFTVIDTETGQYPDMCNIARREEWSENLIYCDIEGFAITEDGYLIAFDECGNMAYCPEDRFKITSEPYKEDKDE